ncbi:Asp23/Gls24 family envelope stress response protein [uncultured Megasphaera sp.]|uniref:Asp23/Gls24 family envelope stress response protein n=1 Tax=uncultured Megasphaera sp. TaxID=165188 RepID=UPI0026582FE1|nr:Asp23/Gls24 family envelope stress response protein [uncultured Megasphaera sp.]
MKEHEDTFTYAVSEGALTEIAAMAALHTAGVVRKQGRGIHVRYDQDRIQADIHIQVHDDIPLRLLALQVQQNVADALRQMTGAEQLTVHVTIEDILFTHR